tara:strand:+ start:2153 stop:2431 length:279 start_codon:yes stop_codon:yes gene_type:complete
MGAEVMLGKIQKRRIEKIAREQWGQVANIRGGKIRGRDAADVRARVAKRLSRDYDVGGLLGSILFALAVRYAVKLIESWLLESLTEQTTDEE